MSNWRMLVRQGGGEIYVDAELVLGIWPHDGGTRLWSLACGYIDLKGSVAKNADALDFQLPEPEPGQQHTEGKDGEAA